MKNFKFMFWGEIEPMVQKVIDEFNNASINDESINALDSEISFLVLDCGIVHGNLNKYDRSAWIAPRNGDNTFGINISF